MNYEFLPMRTFLRKWCWFFTHDSDFGTLAIHEGKPYWGIVFLRVRNLQSKNIIKVCNQILHHDMNFVAGALVVVEDTRIRIRQASTD